MTDEVETGFENPVTEVCSPQQMLESDHVYEVLTHARRRYVCYSLLGDAERSLTDLATKIAGWENDVPERAVTERQRERVYIALYHAHVPKLVEENVVAFDEASETISPAENADRVLAALEGTGSALDGDRRAHGRGSRDDGDR
ncbi:MULTISPECIES: hypothetical protein [unclassified Halorubrum]|uniref:DUF7344 domain-containing protein n=1 Tax=unclassified Halorubrum TaxID=2642239 RepID=UPI000B97F947|nr:MULTISPECIES: hypothetical protein [unclassified Halorubrum]OYR38639.1 hypothetical protein DJ81_17505 [Halorubrum sp. Hd13]OYR41614.1 hypothetical protein DJ75_13695 [Halorubrum sp. Eb13]OYR44425.1 hypothetical protein DJ74_17755 [Halorubrum sp. Ea8]OYR52592.1 hypothetical protein DJ73_10515 [Halorubrum sp. Ea1]